MNIISRIQNKLKAKIRFNEKYREGFLANLSFWKIFLIWFGIIILFSIIYSLLDTNNSYLFNTLNNSKTNQFSDGLYFSLVSATTTGYGDIVPIGFFKFISTLELITGLLILALVTSKLVSMKQETIMEDLYEISFNDKINSLRSSLLLFRQKINKFRYMIEDNEFRKRDLGNVDSILISFSDDINEILQLLNRQIKNSFVKRLNSTQLELLLNSTISSYKRLRQFLFELKETRIKYQEDILTKHVKNLSNLLKQFNKTLTKFNSKENTIKVDKIIEEIEEFNKQNKN